MHEPMLAADRNDVPTTSETAFHRFPKRIKFTAATWQTLERVTFGLLIGGLVALQVLLYSNILIV
jgi:hypothetical protein